MGFALGDLTDTEIIRRSCMRDSSRVQQACWCHLLADVSDGLLPLPCFRQLWMLPEWDGMRHVCLLQHLAVNERHRRCNDHRRLGDDHH